MKKILLPSTVTLFSSAQKGNDAALNDLIARIEKRLYRFCLFLTANPEAARDLTQEAYIKVLENIHTLENPDRFVSWLFKITKNHFLDYVRSSHHKCSTAVEGFEDNILTSSPKSELGMQIAQALEGLSAEERYLVLLVCLEGRSYEEGAELTGLSVEAVRCKIYRLRKSVKTQIFTRDLQF